MYYHLSQRFVLCRSQGQRILSDGQFAAVESYEYGCTVVQYDRIVAVLYYIQYSTALAYSTRTVLYCVLQYLLPLAAARFADFRSAGSRTYSRARPANRIAQLLYSDSRILSKTNSHCYRGL